MTFTDALGHAPMPKQRARFKVEVTGTDHHGMATRAIMGYHSTTGSAIDSMIGILKQWSASHGAIRPGTTVSIVDMTDGGRLYRLEYLGFAPDLLS